MLSIGDMPKKNHYTLTHNSTCLLSDEDILMVELIHRGMFAFDMKPDGLSDLNPHSGVLWQGSKLGIGRAISLEQRGKFSLKTDKFFDLTYHYEEKFDCTM